MIKVINLTDAIEISIQIVSRRTGYASVWHGTLGAIVNVALCCYKIFILFTNFFQKYFNYLECIKKKLMSSFQ